MVELGAGVVVNMWNIDCHHHCCFDVPILPYSDTDQNCHQWYHFVLPDAVVF